MDSHTMALEALYRISQAQLARAMTLIEELWADELVLLDKAKHDIMYGDYTI